MSGQRATTWTFLRGIGVVELAMGLTWVDPDGVTPSRDAAFRWIPWLEPYMIGIAFLVAGCAALVCAGLRSCMFERWAFALCLFPYSSLALIFLAAFIVGAHDAGIVSTISYGGLAYMVWLAAGVTNTPTVGAHSLPSPPKKGVRDGI